MVLEYKENYFMLEKHLLGYVKIAACLKTVSHFHNPFSFYIQQFLSCECDLLFII